jgi:hypothetical protein
MKKLSSFSISSIALLALTASCGAQEISVQFYQGNGTALTSSQTAGVVPADNFNVNTDNATAAVLNDDTGAPTIATLSVDYGRYQTYNSFTAAGDHDLLSGCLNSSGGSSDSIVLSTIPYASYDVYVYGVSDNGSNDTTSAGNTSIFALTPMGGTTQYLSLQPVSNSTSYIQSTNTYDGTGAPPSDFVHGANYVEFTGLTSPNFTLTFSGETSSGTADSFNASLNGLQIVETPEPSTWAMMAAGAGLLGLWQVRSVSRKQKA